MKTILFQGDSITDAGRYRANPQSMGNGYAAMAPAEYWVIDGVHPTPAGYEVIKRQWLKGFAMLENSIFQQKGSAWNRFKSESEV